MRTLSRTTCLGLLSLGMAAGCASTSGRVSPDLKTVASVGDRRLPVVTGTPGSSVVASVDQPTPRLEPRGRISGRVVDDRGLPVQGARVRLAVSSAPGGRIVSTNTDRTGAFNLSGVRSGSDYTVIAEWEEGGDLLSGRSLVQAPDTDVTIRMALAQHESSRPVVSNDEPSNRVRSISDREVIEEEALEAPAKRQASGGPKVNLEDLPPAIEAEAYPTRDRESDRTPAKQNPPSTSRPRHWRPVGETGETPPARSSSFKGVELGAEEPAPGDAETRMAGAFTEREAPIDEGPNPLPPALEPNEGLDEEFPDPSPDSLPAESTRDRSRPRTDRVSRREPEELDTRRGARRSAYSSRSANELEDEGPEPGQLRALPVSRPTQTSRLPREESEPSEPTSSEGVGFPEPLGANVGGPRGPQNQAQPVLPPPLLTEEPGTTGDNIASEGQPELAGSLPPPILSEEEEEGTDPAFAENMGPTEEPELPSEFAESIAAEGGAFQADPTSPALAASSPAQAPSLSNAGAPVEQATSPLTPSEIAQGQEVLGALPPPVLNDQVGPEPAAGVEEKTDQKSVVAQQQDQSIFEQEDRPRTTSEHPHKPDLGGGRRRPRWGDLATLSPKPTTANRATPVEPIPPPKPKDSLQGRPILQRIPFGAEQPAEKTLAASGGAGALAYCDYDPRRQVIKDFQLPDLQGKLVRFQDLDADLILIDFWGTWCSPCLKSTPYLVNLQKQMGSTKFKVIGIACEQSPIPERAEKVASEAERLGINYPILLSGMDGRPCPLLESLKVQNYPTMLIVNREGRILWRGQGATPSVLSKLDRLVASASKNEERRRF